MAEIETPEPVREYVRTGTMKIIDQHWKPTNAKVKWEPWIVEAIKQIKSREDIKIGKADKNNCVVIMDRNEYEAKMLAMIETGPYTVQFIDPTKEDLTKITTILAKLVEAGKMQKEDADRLIPKKPRCPPIYGSPKTHKPEIPLRPIVDFRSSPTYRLASYLAGILKIVTASHKYSVKNSADFVENVKSENLKRGHKKLSFDVVSLFTNVPIRDGIEFVKQRLETENSWRARTSLNILDLTDLLEICVTCTSFTYNGTIYYQNNGTAMGSPISPVFAELVLQHMEITLVENIPHISFYRRYVDDIYAHVHERKCLEVLNMLNSFHTSLKFTMEEETDETEIGELPFLNVMTYTREDRSVGHYVYRKPTFENAYLQYTSYHPQAHKLGVIDTLLTRALRVCDAKYVDQEIKEVQNMLIQRGYPSQLLHERTELVKTKEDIRSRMTSEEIQEQKDENDMKPRIILPFFGKTTNKIARFLRFALNVEIGYFPGIKIGAIVSNFKEKPKRSIVGVYELFCEPNHLGHDVYIGETGIGLEERFHQHKTDVAKNNPNSAVAQHMNKTGHTIGGIKLLEYEPREWIRKIKEALYIRAVENTINNNYGYRVKSIWSSGLVKFFKFKYSERRYLHEDHQG